MYSRLHVPVKKGAAEFWTNCYGERGLVYMNNIKLFLFLCNPSQKKVWEHISLTAIKKQVSFFASQNVFLLDQKVLLASQKVLGQKVWGQKVSSQNVLRVKNGLDKSFYWWVWLGMATPTFKRCSQLIHGRSSGRYPVSLLKATLDLLAMLVLFGECFMKISDTWCGLLHIYFN